MGLEKKCPCLVVYGRRLGERLSGSGSASDRYVIERSVLDCLTSAYEGDLEMDAEGCVTLPNGIMGVIRFHDGTFYDVDPDTLCVQIPRSLRFYQICADSFGDVTAGSALATGNNPAGYPSLCIDFNTNLLANDWTFYQPTHDAISTDQNVEFQANDDIQGNGYYATDRTYHSVYYYSSQKDVSYQGTVAPTFVDPQPGDTYAFNPLTTSIPSGAPAKHEVHAQNFYAIAKMNISLRTATPGVTNPANFQFIEFDVLHRETLRPYIENAFYSPGHTAYANSYFGQLLLTPGTTAGNMIGDIDNTPILRINAVQLNPGTIIDVPHVHVSMRTGT